MWQQQIKILIQWDDMLSKLKSDLIQFEPKSLEIENTSSQVDSIEDKCDEETTEDD